MSKMDGLRAMREAKYAARGTPKRPGVQEATTAKPRPSPAAPPAGDVGPSESDAPAAADALCGHRNMSGRTCTREQGHAAKSHRYS